MMIAVLLPSSHHFTLVRNTLSKRPAKKTNSVPGTTVTAGWLSHFWNLFAGREYRRARDQSNEDRGSRVLPRLIWDVSREVTQFLLQTKTLLKVSPSGSTV
jgi:hypothetical protein